MRIALFTLDSALSARAVLALCQGLAARQGRAGELVLVARSDPYRAQAGGALGQLRAHGRRSGPRILPFLASGYAIPQALGGLRRALGRGPLTRWARARGIPLHSTGDVNGAETAAALRAARPDLILSCHFDQIFTEPTLALARLGGWNIHPGLLPRHRGPLPTFWALLEGGARQPPPFGVSIHRLAAQIDAGGILAQQAVPLPPRTSAATAARLLHQAAIPLLLPLLEQLAAGQAPAEHRPPLLPYCPFPPPALLRQAARQGCRLAGPADWWAALREPSG